jgi:cell fate (sporulation/competence/biofilm development) regulator YmcA (YheA/YmcA/DUF963 family)
VTSGAEPEKKKQPPAAAKEPKSKAAKAAAKTADSIISQVRQAPLSESEVQSLIDILLLKQVRGRIERNIFDTIVLYKYIHVNIDA